MPRRRRMSAVWPSPFLKKDLCLPEPLACLQALTLLLRHTFLIVPSNAVFLPRPSCFQVVSGSKTLRPRDEVFSVRAFSGLFASGSGATRGFARLAFFKWLVDRPWRPRRLLFSSRFWRPRTGPVSPGGSRPKTGPNCSGLFRAAETNGGGAFGFKGAIGLRDWSWRQIGAGGTSSTTGSTQREFQQGLQERPALR